MNDLQARVGAWHEKTFPNASSSIVFDKLQEECEELRKAFYFESDDRIIEEMADVTLVLLALAQKLDHRLLEAVEVKFSINRERSFAGKPGT